MDRQITCGCSSNSDEIHAPDHEFPVLHFCNVLSFFDDKTILLSSLAQMAPSRIIMASLHSRTVHALHNAHIF